MPICKHPLQCRISLKDFYSPETETSSHPMTKPLKVNEEKTSVDPLSSVRKSCPKCDSQRAYETNRVSFNKKTLSPEAIITRYKCVKCGHSWIVYEKDMD